MPSQQHEQWKRDLFNHLDSKLGGCIACEVGEAPRMGVYPRAYGGTSQRAHRRPPLAGLSPRLRGNRYDPIADGDVMGLSPRLRGNRYDPIADGDVMGLSPRLRGNPV